MFFDGERGTGTTGGGIPDDQVVSGHIAQAEDGTWTHPTRPAREVTGWAVCCDCTRGDTSRHTTWIGPTFTRVSSPELEDLAVLRLFARDDDVSYVAERAEVEGAVIDGWRCEHAFSADALSEVETDAIASDDASQRLDAAVAIARHGGASWANIGQAAGMTGQSAHERWCGVDGPGR